jgi:5-methyltetrahydropteroyltriglutamate--homocysteine methyltransferase
MRRSTNRIVTTHTGSLPRPSDVLEHIRNAEKEFGYDDFLFNNRIRTAVEEVVRLQRANGIDIVNDGEVGKPSYATYVKNRVSGFSGESVFQIAGNGESRDFPEFDRRRAAANATVARMPVCEGPIEWQDFAAVQRDIDNLVAAVKSAGAEDAFMTAASPGIITFFLGNRFYSTQEAYEDALVNVMRAEYQAIVAAGLELQIDCPDLAGSRQSRYADSSLKDFRKMVARHIELLNEATKNIPPEKMRMHLCWGNYEGPHHLDVPLRDIVDLVLTARPQVISLEGANPRHEHEWSVWTDVRLPDEKILMVGVIDSTTNYIEHPDLVAERLVRYAGVVGRERVIASSDCGFATFADSNAIDKRIVWAKLRTMADGAAIASKLLW